MDEASGHDGSEPPLLPEAVPVEMPRLPLYLDVTRPDQFKATGDPVRVRILGVIQQRPATAKQLAEILGMPPGTVGHHLQVLEAAGLAQVVARRLVRGIVAKYYTRTARIFVFAPRFSTEDAVSPTIDSLRQARDELAEALAAYGAAASLTWGYPRVRLAPERAAEYRQRLDALLEEFIAEEPDPGGTVYALAGALFVAPPYVQGNPRSVADDGSELKEHGDERADAE
jgi:DNA-binding transcriptional ArsR family regulator